MNNNEDEISEITELVLLGNGAELLKRLAPIVNKYKDELAGWLIIASSEGKIDSAAVLLDLGANVNQSNSEGETAFSFACARNQLQIAKLLFDYGANVNTIDKGGGTPLDWAVCHASPEFRMWLKSIGGLRNSDHPEWPWP